MGLTLPNCDDFEALTQAVNSEGCIAFLGAGLSKPAYKTWPQLVKLLRAGCRTDELRPESISEKDPLKVAGIAKACDQAAYERIIRKEMSPRLNTLAVYMQMAHIPFRMYLTTNYEDQMLQALEAKHGSANVQYIAYPTINLASLPYRCPRDVVFLHGRVVEHQPLHIVLSDDEYDEAYENKNSSLRSFLLQLLPVSQLCFLGCSLDDTMLQGVLQACQQCKERIAATQRSDEPAWFALLHHGSPSADNFERCGIRVVSYDPLDEDHTGLLHILRHWSGYQPPQPRDLFQPPDGYPPQ